jgi:hypothetical protein
VVGLVSPHPEKGIKAVINNAAIRLQDISLPILVFELQQLLFICFLLEYIHYKCISSVQLRLYGLNSCNAIANCCLTFGLIADSLLEAYLPYLEFVRPFQYYRANSF